MKLYTTERAPNPMRVKFFLLEKGMWDSVPRQEINLVGGESQSAEYRAISPFGQVPALELDDGRVLTESKAIQIYFEAMYPEPNLMGRDGPERAFIEMWDRRIEFQVMLAVAMWVRHGHPAMVALENPQCADWAKVNEGRTARMFDWLEGHFGAQDFVAGERFTVADVTLWAATGFARLMKFRAGDGRPNFAAWEARMKSRPMGQG